MQFYKENMEFYRDDEENSPYRVVYYGAEDSVK